MCTLIAVHRRIPGRPLIVAANRDEFFDRPAEGPAIRRIPSGRILAPLDVEAGGTWLGLNEHGVFAGLTNLRCDDPDPARRSRGEVVVDALSAPSACAAAGMLEALETEAYNPFNLFVADEEDAFVAEYRERPSVRPLEPGIHVVGNVEATGPGNPKVRRVREEVEAAVVEAAGDAGRLIDRLGAICRHHESRTDPAAAAPATSDEGDEGGAGRAQSARRKSSTFENREPLSDTCVHVEGTYGTRSSLLLELGEGAAAGRLLHADGAPCRTPYEDVSSLLVDLGRRPATVKTEPLMRTAS